MALRPLTIEDPGADERDGALPPRQTQRLIGQSDAQAMFLDNWKSGRFHHAWLLTGQESVGKASFAWLAARFVLSGGNITRANPFEPDPSTEANHLVSASSHPDLMLIRRRWDEKTKKHKAEIAIDDIRDLKQHFQLAAGLGGYRVCIIDNADELNRNSANALLKLLEEPPPKSLFLLVSHAPARLLPTLRSRCRQLSFHDLSVSDIEAVLRFQPLTEGLADQALTKAATLAEGSVMRAMRYLSPAAMDLRQKTEALLRDLPKIEPRHWMALSRDIQRKEFNGMEIFLEIIISHTQRVAKSALSRDYAMRLAEASSQISAIARDAEIYKTDMGAASLAILQKLQSAHR
jgi:DNA polymerase III subunit delta'